MFASASASGADWRAAIDAALEELPGELPPPTPAGETTESPAAMRVRLQTRRIATSSRQRRI